MADMNKVLKGLDECREWNGRCHRCPYHDKIDISECTANLCRDALEVIREQNQRICELLTELEQLKFKEKMSNE